MLRIAPLTSIDQATLQQLIVGYEAVEISEDGPSLSSLAPAEILTESCATSIGGATYQWDFK
jgi:hypothetical protein